MTVRMALPAALLLLASAALADCGRQGELDRPAPLFGHTQTPSAQLTRRDEAAARARADGAAQSDPRAPQSIDEVRSLGLDRQVQSDSSSSPTASDVAKSPSASSAPAAPPQ